MKVTEFLSPDEIKDFTQPSNFRGFLAVATTWLMIALAFTFVAIYPKWWVILISLTILGGRHLALAILMHECSHYSLFRTRSLNDFVGRWFCGNPTWLDLERYRIHHWAHHRLAGTKNDPDDELVSAYPVPLASMVRKIFRDLSGVSGIRRVYGLILMDLGFIQFTVSSKVIPINQTGRSWKNIFGMGFRNIYGVFIANFAIFAVLWAVGHPWLYSLWIISYLTTFSLILRIRSIAEHACTKYNVDPRLCTRTTLASPLARITVAPHRVNFHLEHHILMNVPYFKLPKLHRLLKGRGKYTDAFIAKNYVEVIRAAIVR